MSSPFRGVTCSVIAIAGLGAPIAAHADDSNFRPYLVGARAAGIGGAFTALADDGSGSYYNPGGPRIRTQVAALALGVGLWIGGRQPPRCSGKWPRLQLPGLQHLSGVRLRGGEVQGRHRGQRTNLQHQRVHSGRGQGGRSGLAGIDPKCFFADRGDADGLGRGHLRPPIRKVGRGSERLLLARHQYHPAGYHRGRPGLIHSVRHHQQSNERIDLRGGGFGRSALRRHRRFSPGSFGLFPRDWRREPAGPLKSWSSMRKISRPPLPCRSARSSAAPGRWEN